VRSSTFQPLGYMQVNAIRGSRAGRLVSACTLAAASVVLATACESEDFGERTTLSSRVGSATEALPPALQLQLDSGNVAFRDREYEEALRHFGAAIRMDPQLAAGWYGLGMTHGAMGDTAAADSAMLQVHVLAPDLPLEHPVGSAPPNPHPIQPEGEPAPP
jgi:tetratricopeptide (TPR) repeat protein